MSRQGDLASLIQRANAEQRQIDVLDGRISSLLDRARSALNKGDEALAQEAAQAIAQMENERTGRTETHARLEQKIVRLRSPSVEAGTRRVVDLKQGAIQARAVRKEQDIQKRLATTLSGRDSASEAEELISRVLGRDDPFEQAEILKRSRTTSATATSRTAWPMPATAPPAASPPMPCWTGSRPPNPLTDENHHE
ncbi:MAG: PspA/IM30 family protein [Paracoccaceae bacterium]